MERYTMSVIKGGGPMKIAPIEMWVSDNEVGLRISLEDYLAALVTEIGNPAFIMTQNAFAKRLNDASAAIVLRMKVESIKAVS